MTDTIIFQFFGMTYLAIGIGMMTSLRFYKNISAKMFESEVSFFLAGLPSFVIGCFLIAYHNIWTSNFTTILTVIGWISFIKGFMMLAFPERSIKICNTVKIAKIPFSDFGAIIALLGFFLVYVGCLVV